MLPICVCRDTTFHLQEDLEIIELLRRFSRAYFRRTAPFNASTVMVEKIPFRIESSSESLSESCFPSKKSPTFLTEEAMAALGVRKLVISISSDKME